MTRVGIAAAAGASAALVALLVASPARADDAAEAKRLFEEGRALYDKKTFDKACDLLASSDRLKPSIDTLGLLASCHEEQGRVATAQAEYTQTAARAHEKGDKREAFARDRAARLDAVVPTITIHVAVAPPGFDLRRDGAKTSIGAREPVDPGPHQIVATATGMRRVQLDVTLAPGQHRDVDLPALELDIAAPPVAVAAAPVAPPPSSSGRRTAAFVIGGVGVAGLLVGGVTGILTFTTYGGRDCTGSSCSSQGLSDVSSARTLALVSDVAFGVGLAGVATGVVLLVTAPKSPTALTLAPGGPASAAGATATLRF
ncbi:MAG TPA: hypothetical protein VGM56_27235 [Byssovorax sp.]